MPREQLDMPDILKIVRKIQPKLVLEAYKSDEAECPQCHVARKVVKGVPVMPKSFCTDNCLKDTVNDLFESDIGFIVDDMVHKVFYGRTTTFFIE
jgi:hypothetical protein